MNSKNDLANLLKITVCVIVIWGSAWALTAHYIADWPTRASFGDMFGAVNSLFSALALIGVVYSVNIQIKSVKIDHDRRKKQSTLEYLNAIRPEFKALFKEYEKEMGPDVLTNNGLQTILSNKDLRNIVKDYLSTLEHLSVGANTGVFDKDLIFRMSAKHLIGRYYKFKPYISHAQKNLGTAYIEFETLIKDFEDRIKVKPSDKGNLE